MKKILFLIFILFLTNANCFAESGLKGQVEKTDALPENQNITGEYIKPSRKTDVKVNVLKLIDSEMSKNGEEFFAKVTEDVEVDEGIIIPNDSVIHGYIKVEPAGKFGHNGHVKLKADYVIMPDGEQKTVSGRMTTKINPIANITNGMAERTVYTLTGAVLGSGVALNLLGADAAILSSGTSIGVGAAVGAIGGICLPFEQKGKNVVILPDDEIAIKIKFSEKMPIYKKNAFMHMEFNDKNFFAEIKNVEYKKNPYKFADNIVLKVKISNGTDKKIDIFSMYILDEKGKKYYANVFEDDSLRDFCVESAKSAETIVPFAVDKVNDHLWLVFEVDGNVVSKLSVVNAYKNLSSETKNKNKKMIEVKKNFYRVETPFD